MNEMYIISVLMLYTLIVLLQAYQLFGTGLVEDRETILSVKPKLIAYISSKITSMSLRINWKKDYRLNMKRRPPIISVAH